MNCQYCETELENKRAKNCQTCNTILTDANKRGTYRFVMEAWQTAKADGLTGSDIQNAMTSASKFGEAQRHQWRKEYDEFQKRVARENYEDFIARMTGPRHDEEELDHIDASKPVPARRDIEVNDNEDYD